MSGSTWTRTKGTAIVKFAFEAAGKYQMSLEVGEEVQLLKETADWYKGRKAKSDEEGIFPRSYVELSHTSAPADDHAASGQAAVTTPASTDASAPASADAAPLPARKSSSRSVGSAAMAKRKRSVGRVGRPLRQLPTPSAGSGTGASASANGEADAGPASSASPGGDAPVDASTASSNDASTASKNDADGQGGGEDTFPQLDDASLLLSQPDRLPGSKPTTSSSNRRRSSLLVRDHQRRSSGVGGAGARNRSSLGAHELLSGGSAKNRRTSTRGGRGMALASAADAASVIASADTGGAAHGGIGSDAKLFSEMRAIVAEWNGQLQADLARQNFSGFHTTQNKISTLLEWKRRLQTAATGERERERVRSAVLKLLEGSRKTGEGFMVPRTETGERAVIEKVGAIALHRMHCGMRDRMHDRTRLPESAPQQAQFDMQHGLRRRRGEAAKADESAASSSAGAGANDRSNAGAASAGASAGGAPASKLQLLVEMKAAMFSVGESSELFFSLWHETRGALTEEFLVALNPAGVPHDVKLLGKMKTVFCDLDRDDVGRGVHLVIRAYRIGALQPDGKHGSGKSDANVSAGRGSSSGDGFRRPYGIALLPLFPFDLHSAAVGHEILPRDNVPLYAPAGGRDAGFAALPAAIARGARAEYELAPRSTGVALSLTPFDGAVYELGEDLGNVHLTPKLRLPSRIDPGDERNDLYITLVGPKSEFAKDSKKAEKNVEVRVAVLLDTGEKIDCLARGTGAQSELDATYRSVVHYHSNAPRFDETIALRIPNEAGQLERCHLLVTMTHCSSDRAKTKPFAFTYLSLTEDKGVVIRDGEHVCQCFKPLSGMEKRDKLINPASYLVDSARLSARTVRTGVTREDEAFIIKTELCSTKRTQNVDLHHLLKWRDLDDERIRDALRSITYSMQGVEIVKFLREIFDVIMALFCEDKDNVDVLRARKDASKAHADEAGAMELLVFDLFVHVLNVITRSREYKGFTPLLDSYIDELFRGPRVYVVLIRCINHYVKQLATDESARALNSQARRTLTNAMSCFAFIMRFIVTSREQALTEAHDAPGAPPPPMTDSDFRQSITVHLEFINGLMQRDVTTLPWIKVLQGKLMSMIAPLFRELQHVFHVGRDLGMYVRTFLEALPVFWTGAVPGAHTRSPGAVQGGDGTHTAAKVVSSMNADKLLLVKDIVMSDLFADTEAQMQILGPVVDIMMQHINNSNDERPLCIAVLTELLAQLHTSQAGAEQVWTVCQLLPPATSALLEVQRDLSHHRTHGHNKHNTGDAAEFAAVEAAKRGVNEHIDLATCMMCLLHLMDDEQMDGFLHGIVGADVATQKEFMLDMMRAFAEVLRRAIYPAEWLSMCMFAYRVMVRFMRWVADQLHSHWFADAETDIRDEEQDSLWGRFFALGIALLRERAPALESSGTTAAKRAFLREGWGDDIRLQVVALMRQVWSELGPLQLELSAGMVGPLLQLGTSACESIASMGADFYFDLTKHEFAATRGFRKIEHETIDAVDRAVRRKGTEGRGLMDMFSRTLRAKFGADETLNCTEGLLFLSDVRDLFELLRAMAKYRAVAEFEEDRTAAILKLLAYLDRTKRSDMFIKYAHSLCDMHFELSNFVEAGKSLLLHAEMLPWDSQEREEELVLHSTRRGYPYPPETQCERRETLYREAIELFERGQDWESACALCEALRRRHQEVTFDYAQLSELLRQQADLFERAMKTERFYPAHFRVGFYGKGFGDGYRNVEYVYRGDNLESIIDFSGRIKAKHEGAKTLPSKTVPSAEHFDSTDRFLQFSILTPAPSSEMDEIGESSGGGGGGGGGTGWGPDNLPARVLQYRQQNEVDTFYFRRIFRKRETKSANEFLDLWVTKHYLRTEKSFPTTARRQRVVTRQVVTLNPLEMAVAAVCEKNEELRDKIAAMAKVADGAAEQGMTMAINGVVDAAVNGGTMNYATFITGDYRETNPEIAEDIDAHPHKHGLVDKLVAALKEQVEVLRPGIEIHGRKCSEQMRPLHAHIEQCFAKMEVVTRELVEQLPGAKAQ